MRHDRARELRRTQTDAEKRLWSLLRHQGFRILRPWNNDILGNAEGVVERIRQVLAEPPPLPPTP